MAINALRYQAGIAGWRIRAELVKLGATFRDLRDDEGRRRGTWLALQRELLGLRQQLETAGRYVFLQEQAD